MDNEELDEMVVTNGGDLEIDSEDTEAEETSEEVDEEEDYITIDGESPPVQEEDKPAPQWVKELRKKHRTQTEENRQLKAELERVKNGNTVEVSSLPPKPKLSEYDYDEDDYEAAMELWQTKKLQHEVSEQEKAKKVEEQNNQNKVILENYAKSKENLKVKDFDIVEDYVVEKLPIEFQNVILAVAENPAVVVYAIGKDKTKLDELSKITNPFLFAKELGKMEGKLKVERKKMPPAPEKTVKGSASHSNSGDSKLDKLREEAMKSGDMSKVMAYKRALKK